MVLIQIKILNEEYFEENPPEFRDQFESFEDYINFELGILYDDDRPILSVIPSDDLKRFVILYTIPFGNN